MQGKILVFVGLLATLAYGELSATGCEMFNCKLPSQKFGSNTCVYFNQKTNTYYVQPCSGDNYCPALHNSNSTCQAEQNFTAQGWPGEKCTTASDCNAYAYKGCVGGICTGAAKGGGCQDSNSCNPGLYCSKRFCVSQLQVGQSGCNSDFDCVNGAGCNFTGNAATSTCVAYLSIQPHAPVAQCQINQNRLCSSLTCAQLNGANYCTNPLKSYAFIPMACDDNSECTSSNDPFFGNNFDLSSSCDCALNPNGNRYCGLFPGDAPGQSYLSQLALWYQSNEMNNCNTFRRHSDGCMNSWWDAKDMAFYNYYNLNYKMYAFVQNMPDCVAQVYLPEYYYAKQQYQQYQNQ
ncbi:unnamed protein product [Blepharisma stoltei]|uniref:Dickkopf N-terminal cysteine-rich domain-containing protein n=1 Tax=Blepharisma stoltei TaxID=1481888 RepID=A0AAU9ING6_9CILI|nr:unnamed protein product [Blepharisma stoltei]